MPGSKSSPTTALAASLVLAALLPAGAQPPESRRIDQLVESNLKEHGITPNPPASDEVFLRRIYLDLIGRIPTRAEAEAFLAYEGSGKRARLIDHLLDSDGYVSHSFNYWADLLRAKSNMQGNSGGAYIDWLKTSIADNMPYDQMVHALITSEGKVWDNGAVGYYMRDSGMPLDNMSNTARIFLGTRLECAQCHNHPFDKWTQLDYYKLAQFTYGVSTRVNAQGELGIQEIIDKDAKRRRSKLNLTRSARRALSDILQPLSYGAGDTDRKVSLPDDYAYENKPSGPVAAAVPFGDDIKSSRKKSQRELYADWMVSPDNPRFTTVITNRMWKRALGIGLIEPVDDLKDTTVASNPQLMRYLEGVLRGGGYDLKRFMRIVYNTRTYQREATTEEVPADAPYRFQGPLLRRMTAEQLWDSYITLSLPDPDGRKGNYGRRGRDAKAQVDALRGRSPKSIIDQAIAIGIAEDAYRAATERLREQMQVASAADDAERLKQLRREMNTANKQRQEAIAAANKAASAGSMMGSSMSAMDMMAMKRREEMEAKAAADRKARGIKEPRDPWQGYGKHLMRASELESPTRDGHFLRQFGQSDRDLIENGHKDTSVSQALDLLNGPVARDVLNPKSVLRKSLAADMSSEEKVDALFMSILAHPPTDRQRDIATRQLEQNKQTGVDNLIWALMNTSEFAFVQ